MKSFAEYQNLFEGRDSKLEGITDLANAIKSVLKEYDIHTRRLIWKAITSDKGKSLIDKLVRVPGYSLSVSEFRKLVN